MTRDRQRAERIVANLPVGVIVVDDEMRLVDLNPSAEEILGWAPPEVLGRRLPDLSGPELWSEGSALVEAMETGRQVEPRVTTVRGDDAEIDDQTARRRQRRLLVGAAPLEDGYVLSLHEADPFHQIEAKKVSDLSHDVRSPLASIRAYTELLVEGVDGGDPELRQQFLDVIDQRARHLTDLVVNLTGLVRWRLGYLQLVKMPVSLHELAAEAVSAFQVQARQNDVRLVLDAAHDLDLTLADRDAVSTLLRNLIDNAVKFSTSGGDVVIAVRQDEGHQIVRVIDEGCGIAQDDLPYIFDPFYRGGNVVAAGLEGSGLGLALVKAIAEAHGGAVEVASEEKKGTTVTVTLPGEENAVGHRRPSEQETDSER